MKIMRRRRFAATLATLAAMAFAAGTYVASNDPAAGTAGFVREVANRMNLTPALLRLTVDATPSDSRGAVPHGDRR